MPSCATRRINLSFGALAADVGEAFMRAWLRIGRPFPEDGAGSERLKPGRWDDLISTASDALARRICLALPVYLVLLGVLAWATKDAAAGPLWRETPFIAVAAGLAVTGLIRLHVARRPRPTHAWWRIFGSFTVVNAALWGALGVFVVLKYRVSAPSIVLWLVLAGLAAGATTSLTPSPFLGRLFAWGAIGPVAGAQALLGGASAGPLAAAAVTYLIILTVQSSLASRSFWTSLLDQALLTDQARVLDDARQTAEGALAAREGIVAELTMFRENARRDYAVAARVFEGIARRSRFDLSSLRASFSPMEQFSGDVAMADGLPDGRLRILVGDFTGHGLSAAVGALPLSEAFFASTRKALTLDTLIREINRKVAITLPRGLFLSVFAADLDPHKGELRYWNGGLPAAYILDEKGRVCAELSSSNVPLGIVSDEQLGQATVVSLERGQRLFVFSDGVTEAADAAGEMFGDDRLKAALAAGGDEFFSLGLDRALDQYRGKAALTDDVTYLEVKNDEPLARDLEAVPGARAHQVSAGHN